MSLQWGWTKTRPDTAEWGTELSGLYPTGSHMLHVEKALQREHWEASQARLGPWAAGCDHFGPVDREPAIYWMLHGMRPRALPPSHGCCPSPRSKSAPVSLHQKMSLRPAGGTKPGGDESQTCPTGFQVIFSKEAKTDGEVPCTA